MRQAKHSQHLSNNTPHHQTTHKKIQITLNISQTIFDTTVKTHETSKGCTTSRDKVVASPLLQKTPYHSSFFQTTPFSTSCVQQVHSQNILTTGLLKAETLLPTKVYYSTSSIPSSAPSSACSSSASRPPS